MAKSSRSSSKKANNQRKAASIFGPVESARAERLSARLLEAAKQPKPETSDVNMDAQDDRELPKAQNNKTDETAMDVDPVKPSKARIGKNRIERRVKKSKHVFTKYSDRKAAMKKTKKAA